MDERNGTDPGKRLLASIFTTVCLHGGPAMWQPLTPQQGLPILWHISFESEKNHKMSFSVRGSEGGPHFVGADPLIMGEMSSQTQP